MKLSKKIVRLRKVNGWSQEDLAEKLNVSRQAISRWEGATAQPDATNILQLSKLFGITTDYLLNDEYESDNDLPKVKQINSDGIHQIMILMVTLEVMILIIQFMSTIILQKIFFGILSFIPFVAVIGGFEYAYQKNKSFGLTRFFNIRNSQLTFYAYDCSVTAVSFQISNRSVFYLNT